MGHTRRSLHSSAETCTAATGLSPLAWTLGSQTPALRSPLLCISRPSPRRALPAPRLGSARLAVGGGQAGRPLHPGEGSPRVALLARRRHLPHSKTPRAGGERGLPSRRRGRGRQGAGGLSPSGAGRGGGLRRRNRAAAGGAYRMKVVLPVLYCPTSSTMGLFSKSASSKAGEWKSWKR